MITVRLIGGLGNQMFQYATGRALAMRRGESLRVDLGWFADQPPQDTPRTYELDVFRCDAGLEKTVVPVPEPRGRLGRALVRAGEALGMRGRILRQQGTGFDRRVLDAPAGTHLIGYWQSEKYFADVSDTIRADLTLSRPLSQTARGLLARIETETGAISLHVRRGDYVSNPHALRYHGLLDVEYYRRAVGQIGEHVAQPSLYVFSDDPDWCEVHLDLGLPTTIVRSDDGRPAHEDLVLMSGCRHHVIANSSFSWWGAWLDARPDSIVVAPRRWTLDEKSDFSDVYGAGWLRA